MGQLRKQAKALSVRVKEGDADAASELLEHSVRLGHGKLALRRFFLARGMGATVSKEAERYCRAVLAKLPTGAAEAIEDEERRRAHRYMKRKTSDG